MKRSKFITTTIIFIVLVTMITGCNFNSTEPVKKQEEGRGRPTVDSRHPKQDYPELTKKVKENLEEGYHEKFNVRRIEYIDHTGVYVIYCNPKSDKEFVFEVKTGGYKYGEGFKDRYGKEVVDKKVEEYYKPIIEKLFPYKLVCNPNFNTYTNWGRIPSAKELIEEDSENTKIYLDIYIFEEVMEEDKENFLKSVLELINLLENQDLKESNIRIAIYEGELFEGIDPEWFMEATDWMSHDVYADEEHKDVIEYTDVDKYKDQLKNGFYIETEDYNQIQTIKDIENRVWQD